jgi:hypothetical protein
MADCVNASVQVEQAAAPQSTLDRLAAEAKLAQLRSRDDTVLPRRKRGQRPFPLDSFRAIWSPGRVSFGSIGTLSSGALTLAPLLCD